MTSALTPEARARAQEVARLRELQAQYEARALNKGLVPQTRFTAGCSAITCRDAADSLEAEATLTEKSDG